MLSRNIILLVIHSYESAFARHVSPGSADLRRTMCKFTALAKPEHVDATWRSPAFTGQKPDSLAPCEERIAKIIRGLRMHNYITKVDAKKVKEEQELAIEIIVRIVHISEVILAILETKPSYKSRGSREGRCSQHRKLEDRRFAN